jgi:hypothetical protein
MEKIRACATEREIGLVSINNSPLFGNEIGVVERWEHPLKGGTAVDSSMDEISEIRREIASSSEWREDQRADMWVGKAIATALNIDSEEKARLKSNWSGRDGDVLVIKAPSRTLNPTIDQADIDAANGGRPSPRFR